MTSIELADDRGHPWRLADALGQHAATVLLPYRGHW